MKIVVNCTKPLWPEQAKEMVARVATFFGTTPENVLLLNNASVAVLDAEAAPEVVRLHEAEEV